MLISDRLYFAAQYIKHALIIDAPFDTGNMALNSIRIIQDNGEHHIVIGGEVAPYAIWVNDGRPDRAPVGKEIGNIGWIERTIEKSKPMLQQLLGGKITREELDKEYEKQRQKIKSLNDKRAELLKNKEDNMRERLMR